MDSFIFLERLRVSICLGQSQLVLFHFLRRRRLLRQQLAQRFVVAAQLIPQGLGFLQVGGGLGGLASLTTGFCGAQRFFLGGKIRARLRQFSLRPYYPARKSTGRA